MLVNVVSRAIRAVTYTSKEAGATWAAAGRAGPKLDVANSSPAISTSADPR
jgi:hypothetical protein